MSERHYHKHRASSPSPVLALLKIGADSYNSGGKSYHGRIYDSVLDTSESLSHLTRKRKRRSRTSSLSSGDHSSTSHAKKKGRSYNASRSRSRSESSKLPHSKKAKKVKGIQKRHKKKHLKTRRRSSSSDDSSDESSSTSESQSSGDEIKKKRKHSHKEPKPSEHKRTKRLSKDSVHKSKKSKKEKHIIKYKRKLQTKKGKKFTDDSVDAASTTVAVGGAGLSIQTVDTKSASSVGAGSSSRSRGPMTKEEYEKQQSVVRRVFDPDTGRHRLVKGDGEIIEEIVSKERHKAINKQATKGDGLSFQSGLRKLL